jgi:hypothetical protein
VPKTRQAEEVNLWIVGLVALLFFGVNEARKGEMRSIPYAGLVFLAVVGSLLAVWLLMEWVSPE